MVSAAINMASERDNATFWGKDKVTIFWPVLRAHPLTKRETSSPALRASCLLFTAAARVRRSQDQQEGSGISSPECAVCRTASVFKCHTASVCGKAFIVQCAWNGISASHAGFCTRVDGGQEKLGDPPSLLLLLLLLLLASVPTVTDSLPLHFSPIWSLSSGGTSKRREG